MTLASTGVPAERGPEGLPDEAHRHLDARRPALRLRHRGHLRRAAVHEGGPRPHHDERGVRRQLAAVPGRGTRRAARRQDGRRPGPKGQPARLRASCSWSARSALALAPNVTIMVLVRIILGFGVGAAAATVPLYLAEMAPVHRRGRMVTINELMIVTGQLLAFAMNALLDQIIEDPNVWRIDARRRRRPRGLPVRRHVLPAGLAALVRRPRPARRHPARARAEPRPGRGGRGVQRHRRARQARRRPRTRAPRCATCGRSRGCDGSCGSAAVSPPCSRRPASTR